MLWFTIIESSFFNFEKLLFAQKFFDRKLLIFYDSHYPIPFESIKNSHYVENSKNLNVVKDKPMSIFQIRTRPNT